MKPQTYLRLALLFPYLLWAMVLPLIRVYGGDLNPLMSTIPRLLFLLPSLYVIGIIFWFVPYTLLAVALLLWSIKRQTKAILIVFASSPLLLTALMLLEINLLSLATQNVTYSSANSNVGDLMALNQVVIFASLVIGYFCVAIGFALYRFLQSLHILRESGAEVQPILKEA
jgi:hypothetical protein